MRRSEVLLSMGLLAVAVGLSPAVSFDGSRSPEGTTVAVPLPGQGAAGTPGLEGLATPLAAVPIPSADVPRPMMPSSPQEAFRAGTQALRQGRTDQAIAELEYAAEQGVPGALWKLGRIYADGDGVLPNRTLAYEYFRRLTLIYADESSGTPNARYLANAFVTLGQFYLDGIPGTLKADAVRARDAFHYAASYYADAEAQYYLGRLYLSGKGVQKDPIQAARWLQLSAEKGDHRAQAMLGEMLVKGDEVARQAARGLFWLIIAKDGAAPEERWIGDMYSTALAQASEGDRALAHKYLEEWLKRRP
jgi:TPR repeat protein